MGLSGTVVGTSLTLLWSIGGGIICGAVIAALMLCLSGRTTDPLIEITFTTLAAYGSFLLAEHSHSSGVLAAMTAGLLTGGHWAGDAITAPGRLALEAFWEYPAFLANSLVFIFICVREAQQHFSGEWLPALVAIVLVAVGRAGQSIRSAQRLFAAD